MTAAAQAFTAVFFALLTASAASGQALSVVPVNIFLSPGQKATSLTVTNQGTSETAIQIRAYDWSQKNGEDQLTVFGQIPEGTVPAADSYADTITATITY